jgi:hypothetical protein
MDLRGSGGIQTPFGTVIQPGCRVVYVRSTGVQSGDEAYLINQPPVTTLNAALAQCRPGLGDTVFVLPGHVENISSANQMSNLVAGTRIVGLGYGTLRPTFTWTAATATFLFNKANVSLENCILNMDPGAGTVTVAAPITISAAGCSIIGCQVRASTDANSLATIPITTTAAGDDLTIAACYMFGATAGTPTTIVRLVGADRFKMFNCFISAATSAVAVGVVQMLTTASLGVQIENCFFQNSLASSTAGFTGMTGATGQLNNCRASVLSGGAAAFATLGSLTLFNCQASNALGGGNAISPAAQTMA